MVRITGTGLAAICRAEELERSERHPQQIRQHVPRARGAPMTTRQILITILILGTVWHTAAAQPEKTEVEAPPLERVLSGTSIQSNAVLSDVIASKPEMPLGPQDILMSYEIAMSLVVDQTSADFSVIVQAQQTNQITREQAEYLLLQSYQTARMRYQVLSALHDVLKHDIDEAAEQQARQSLKTASSDTVLVVPFPGSAPASR